MPAELALGTAQLGAEYGIANQTGMPDREDAERLLDRAYQNGIHLWDTSPLYGASEQIIGQWIARTEEQPRICTKLPSADGSLRDIKRHVRTHVEESLQRLRRSFVDYYLIHDERDFERFGAELLESLNEQKATGRIRKVGITVYSLDIAHAALEANGLDVIQLPCSVLDHRFAEVAAKAASRSVEIHARSVFLQGLFFLQDDDVACKLPDALDYVRGLREVATQMGRSIAETAFCYVRGVPGVTAMIVGMETTAQLEENLRLKDCRSITGAERTLINDRFADTPETIVNPSLWTHTA